jgi:hypothetical protein
MMSDRQVLGNLALLQIEFAGEMLARPLLEWSAIK